MYSQKIHHVAYRCKDARETIDWYGDKLGMKYLLAVAEDEVPSTKEPSPYMHLFLDAGGGNILAFFELPESPPMGTDPNTPAWVQHLAFEVADEATLLAAKADLVAKGVDVLGPTDHGFLKSIYFFDPNGHRLEFTTRSGPPDAIERLAAISGRMLEEWTRTKRAPRHAAWVHEAELGQR